LIASLFIAAAPAATAAPLGAVTAPPLPTATAPSWGSEHVAFLYLVQILFIVTVIGLIGLMSIQTTKTEGLSGSIGGRMESAYKGRLGIEQQLARLTTGFAVAFMFLAILDFLITR
jgi:preprotein translocase subunit SecG